MGKNAPFFVYRAFFFSVPRGWQPCFGGIHKPTHLMMNLSSLPMSATSSRLSSASAMASRRKNPGGSEEKEERRRRRRRAEEDLEVERWEEGSEGRRRSGKEK